MAKTRKTGAEVETKKQPVDKERPPTRVSKRGQERDADLEQKTIQEKESRGKKRKAEEESEDVVKTRGRKTGVGKEKFAQSSSQGKVASEVEENDEGDEREVSLMTMYRREIDSLKKQLNDSQWMVISLENQLKSLQEKGRGQTEGEGRGKGEVEKEVLFGDSPKSGLQETSFSQVLKILDKDLEQYLK